VGVTLAYNAAVSIHQELSGLTPRHHLA